MQKVWKRFEWTHIYRVSKFYKKPKIFYSIGSFHMHNTKQNNDKNNKQTW